MKGYYLVKISTLIIISLFLSSSFLTGYGVGLKLSKKDDIFLESLDDINNEVPNWNVGHEWKYDFKFDYKYSGSISLDGQIKNLKIKVLSIDNQEDEYKLKLTGRMTGSITLFGFLSGGFFDVDLDGNVYMKKSTLALKNFKFKLDGSYLFFAASGEVEMDFGPAFDILDFPILTEEDASNPWWASTYGTMEGFFQTIIFFIPYRWPFHRGHSFMEEQLHLVNIEERTVPAGTYNCFKISGNIGPSHDGKSNIWYSPEAGYLVEVDEEINNWNNVDLSLNMKLKDTNFEQMTNNPPNKPSNPNPENHATDVSINTFLIWTGSDPDPNDTVTYDVYFGTDSSPDSGELVSEKQLSTNYDPPELLEPETTYYWKIIAYDIQGESTHGDVWEFTTAEADPINNPPGTPRITGPTTIKVHEKNIYEVVSTDPDRDDIFYLLLLLKEGVSIAGDAGIGPSGVKANLSVTLPFEGNYEIKVQATDNISGWSDWGILSIKCPKVKTFNPLFYQFTRLQRLFNTISNKLYNL